MIIPFSLCFSMSFSGSLYRWISLCKMREHRDVYKKMALDLAKNCANCRVVRYFRRCATIQDVENETAWCQLLFLSMVFFSLLLLLLRFVIIKTFSGPVQRVASTQSRSYFTRFVVDRHENEWTNGWTNEQNTYTQHTTILWRILNFYIARDLNTSQRIVCCWWDAPFCLLGLL